MSLQSILAGYGGSSGGGATDSDAIAFLAAASITDPTISSAIDDLVIGLKADSLWTTDLQAIYPMVGGTAGTHKWNLRDPQDTNGAFRLTFAGGWTHASTGALPNGSTGNADTHYQMDVSATLNDTHLSVYSRTLTAAGSQVEIGGWDAIPTITWLLQVRATGDLIIGDSYDYNASAGRMTFANSDSRGHFIENRTASNAHTLWKNGSKQATDTNSAGSLSNFNIFLGAMSAAPTNPSDREIAFATIGKGLSDADALALYNRIQTFQTALSRNV